MRPYATNENNAVSLSELEVEIRSSFPARENMKSTESAKNMGLMLSAGKHGIDNKRGKTSMEHVKSMVSARKHVTSGKRGKTWNRWLAWENQKPVASGQAQTGSRWQRMASGKREPNHRSTAFSLLPIGLKGKRLKINTAIWKRCSIKIHTSPVPSIL